MDKPTLINKIKSLDGLSNDEKADLIHLLNETKQYGLVWEDKPEDVERDLLTMLPVLCEVPEKRILASEIVKEEGQKVEAEKSESLPGTMSMFPDESNTKDELSLSAKKQSAAPNHILIEGDNLHALTALTFTHEGKIDVIYIDPPYNTGNKDFKYNDSFVDKEDTYRHSKWLSFMNKRLEIAKQLLNENGVIFISIDDNEQSQLKLLCDEVFGENNFIETIIWKNKYGPGAMTKGFGNIHEYIITYSKKQLISIESILSEEEIKNYKNKDEYFNTRGGYITQPLATKSKDDRPNLVYPIIHNGIEIWPDKQWIWSKERMFEAKTKNQLYINGEGDKWSVRFKQYLKDENGYIRKGKPISIFIGPYNQDGTKELENLFQNKIFNNPKPTALINRLISMSINGIDNKKATILDFFAGSGTTLQATMQLNAKDGGNRQCILVTNNENNICEEVTYERNKRVIQGYTNAKGIQIPGLTNNNLHYYKTAFVSREKTTKNKKQLTLLATELLCIKEDLYTELTRINDFIFNPKTTRCFSDKGRYLLIIYDEEIIEQLVPVIDVIDSKSKVKVYVFAPGQYPFTEEFEEVLHKVELGALPDAIYKAYMAVLPRKSDRRFAEAANTESEVVSTTEETEADLFTENNAGL